MANLHCDTCVRICDGCQEVKEMKDVGITIFRYKVNLSNVQGDTNTDKLVKTTGSTKDVFIIMNTEDTADRAAEEVPRLAMHDIKCKRCQFIYKLHTQKHAEINRVIDINEIVGICDHCRYKQQTPKIRNLCDDIIKKYFFDKSQRKEDEHFKTCLEPATRRAHSDTDLRKMLHKSLKSLVSETKEWQQPLRYYSVDSLITSFPSKPDEYYYNLNKYYFPKDVIEEIPVKAVSSAEIIAEMRKRKRIQKEEALRKLESEQFIDLKPLKKDIKIPLKGEEKVKEEFLVQKIMEKEIKTILPNKITKSLEKEDKGKEEQLPQKDKVKTKKELQSTPPPRLTKLSDKRDQKQEAILPPKRKEEKEKEIPTPPTPTKPTKPLEKIDKGKEQKLPQKEKTEKVKEQPVLSPIKKPSGKEDRKKEEQLPQKEKKDKVKELLVPPQPPITKRPEKEGKKKEEQLPQKEKKEKVKVPPVPPPPQPITKLSEKEDKKKEQQVPQKGKKEKVKELPVPPQSIKKPSEKEDKEKDEQVPQKGKKEKVKVPPVPPPPQPITKLSEKEDKKKEEQVPQKGKKEKVKVPPVPPPPQPITKLSEKEDKKKEEQVPQKGKKEKVKEPPVPPPPPPPLTKLSEKEDKEKEEQVPQKGKKEKVKLPPVPPPPQPITKSSEKEEQIPPPEKRDKIKEELLPQKEKKLAETPPIKKPQEKEEQLPQKGKKEKLKEPVLAQKGNLEQTKIQKLPQNRDKTKIEQPLSPEKIIKKAKRKKDENLDSVPKKQRIKVTDFLPKYLQDKPKKKMALKVPKGEKISAGPQFKRVTVGGEDDEVPADYVIPTDLAGLKAKLQQQQEDTKNKCLELKMNEVIMATADKETLNYVMIASKAMTQNDLTLPTIPEYFLLKILTNDIGFDVKQQLDALRHKAKLLGNSSIELDLDSILNTNVRKQAWTPDSRDMIKGQEIVELNYADLYSEVDLSKKPEIFETNYKAFPPATTREESIEKPPEFIDMDDANVLRYSLSDRSFIDKGWTMLPTEKVLRKMNIYRMRPAQPQFDWFKRNKNKGRMTYDTGEKLAEFEDDGRARCYYRNGRLAINYYDAEEANAQQRFVVYSSGEPDKRCRSQPITVLAMFDFLGNGIVFDHGGKIRLKYNQTEGVVLDRALGPVTHWKWHSLNDPPVLQQVMIDTNMANKDPAILKLGVYGVNHKVRRQDDERMLAIELDNFVKEKTKKLSAPFHPFQIKMKAMKINEQFSLRIMDQARIYLIYHDGSTHMKFNIGMILDHHEIIDTEVAEVGDVSNNLEKSPARSDSIEELQRCLKKSQMANRVCTMREQRIRPPAPRTTESADEMAATVSRRRHPPTFIGQATEPQHYYQSRKLCNRLYYDTSIA